MTEELLYLCSLGGGGGGANINFSVASSVLTNLQGINRLPQGCRATGVELKHATLFDMK
jgi:hypothetical protein